MAGKTVFDTLNPRALLIAALLAAAPTAAHAQVVSADQGSRLGVRPVDQIPSHAPHLPSRLAMGLESESDHELLPTMAQLYRRHAAVLEAQANEDYILVEARLGAIIDDLSDLTNRPEFLSDDRFAEFYHTVLAEHDRFFGPNYEQLAKLEEVYTARAQTFEALDNLANPLDASEGEENGLPTPFMVTTTQVPMTLNKAVTTTMRVLLEKRPETLQAWAERAYTWFPMIEEIFAEEGVPDELKYLAMIESGLRPSVRSRASAVGMWQFISATGRAYDLVIDSWVDERMDPEKATRASARHLKDLYARWGDWHVAMSGYNCSPRCLSRAKRSARDKGIENPTFWDMYPYLPRETRNYIPQYIATSIMLSNPGAYGIVAETPGAPFEYELLPIRGSLALRDVARMAGTSTEVIVELNPALRRGYLPPSAKPYPLRLPKGTSDQFLTAYAELPVEALRPPGEYTVKGGDTLSQIAASHGVSVSRLRSDNGVRGSTIHPGQRLIVPVSNYTLPIAEAVGEAEAVAISYAGMNLRPIHSLGAIELERTENIPEMQRSTPTASPQRVAAAQPQGRRVTYTVKPNDTLSQIAEAHGVGLSRLRSWNGIGRDNIRAGSTLVVYVSESWSGLAQNGSATSAQSTPKRESQYTVKSGDTLSAIASSHGVSTRQIQGWNRLSGTRIRPGQTLRVSDDSRRTHEVRRGDTLTGIAKTYRVSISDLRRWNGLTGDRIFPGKTLVVAEGQ
ncbi:MAG: membrane-bound lytic murein transglycosylase D [Rhodothermales bacterium]